MSDRLSVFDCRVSTVEEPEINPSLLVCLAGCPYSCAFCNAGTRMRTAGRWVFLNALAEQSHAAVRAVGVRSVQLTGGEPWLQARAIGQLTPALRPLPTVFNTAFPAPIRRMRGLLSRMDVIIGSLKFGNERCASRLRGPGVRQARARLLAASALGPKLIVRHLLMPGHMLCCTIPTLLWLAARLPRSRVTLLPGYIPPASAPAAPELLRCLDEAEIRLAHAYGEELGLDVVDLPPPFSPGNEAAPGIWPCTPWQDDREQRPGGGRVEGSGGDRRFSRSAPGCPGNKAAPAGPSRVPEQEIVIDAAGRICFAGFDPAARSLLERAGLVALPRRRE